MNRAFLPFMIIVFMLYEICDAGEKELAALRLMDSKIAQVEDSIRNYNPGWSSELLTSSNINGFQARYLELRSNLSPALTLTIQSVRERTEKLGTMGQTLASLPGISSDLLTIIDYETRLNHIEFLLNSQRSIIATRLSILIAIFFGAFGLFFGMGSLVVTYLGNRRFANRLLEISGKFNSLQKRLRRMSFNGRFRVGHI